jgi:5-methylcytosine-specific restriction endonuclease McrA
MEAMVSYQRDWYGSNAETVNERARLWEKANPEKVSEKNRRCYEDNRRKRAEDFKRWAAANPGYKRRQYAANPGTYAEIGRRRRARKASVLTVPFTAAQLAQRMAYWGDRCWMCSGQYDEVDHVIPIALGGPHCLSNLRPACRSCNASKGARRAS